MRKTKGFSIIELLVVMLFLAIMVVLAFRVSDSIAVKSRFTGLINSFLADFNSAKLLASTENRYVAITFAADGRSYTLQKQTDITNFAGWTQVRTVRPLSNGAFFNPGEVGDFAVNSTGEIRLLPIDITLPPDNVSLSFFIRRGLGEATDPVLYRRRIRIFPYGGLKVEKN